MLKKKKEERISKITEETDFRIFVHLLIKGFSPLFLLVFDNNGDYQQGRVAQSAERLTEGSEVLGSVSV